MFLSSGASTPGTVVGTSGAGLNLRNARSEYSPRTSAELVAGAISATSATHATAQSDLRIFGQR